MISVRQQGKALFVKIGLLTNHLGVKQHSTSLLYPRFSSTVDHNRGGLCRAINHD